MEHGEIERDMRARVALGVFCVGLLVAAAFHRAHGSAVADSRTYIEMTAGVAKNGLPFLDNGPLGQHAGLQAPWNIISHGHLWGMYVPLYPYFAAPFLRVGGLTLMSSATFALLVPIALAEFAFARLVIGSERYAALAAVLTSVSTPILGKAVEPSPFPLAVALSTLSAWMVLKAVAEPTRRRFAFAAAGGISAGLAVDAHLLWFPVAATLLLACATVQIYPSTGSAPRWLGPRLSSLWPNEAKVRTSLAFGVGLAASVAPLAYLNHVRFGTWSPFSYGPAPWHGGPEVVANMTMGRQLAFGLPCFAWAAVVIAAIYFRRRFPTVSVATLVGAGLFVVLHDTFREHLVTMIKLGYAFVIEIGLANAENYAPHPGTFGPFRGGRVVKSLLQSTPILALGVIPWADRSDRGKRVLIALACCGTLYLYLLLRADQGLDFAMGQPWVGQRYTFPAIPMLMALAMTAVRTLELRARHWAVGIAAAVALGLAVTLIDKDDDNRTQVLVLLVPLAVALGSFGVMLAIRRGMALERTARWVVGACVGVGLGVAFSHDYRLALWVQRGCDARVDTFAAIAPNRFAVFGNVADLDGVLPLRTSRDVEYADLLEWSDWTEVRPLLDHWFAEGRPVFFAAGWPRRVSPWPDIQFELLSSEVHGFYRVQRIAQPLP